MQNTSYYILVIFLIITFTFSLIKKNNAYDSFIKGATNAIKLGISLFPYLLVMLVAVEVFRASMFLNILFSNINFPIDLLLQGIFRPISSHASLSLMISIYKDYGVDSNAGIISSILQGGNDTTCYVMGLYFGVCGIKKTRHAYIVGLLCDIVAFILCIILYFLMI